MKRFHPDLQHGAFADDRIDTFEPVPALGNPVVDVGKLRLMYESGVLSLEYAKRVHSVLKHLQM